MSITQRRIASRKASAEYLDVQRYCAKEDMRLSQDQVEGYWLHYDGRMRFVRYLSDVRGVVDWILATP